MSDRPVRLGIIGTGLATRYLHLPPLERLSEQFEIVALCNRTRSKAEDLAREIGGTPRITTDYRELLADPQVEAVDISLPIVLNEPVTLEALDAGKHIILEKPIGHNVEAGRKVVEAAREHPDLVLLVAENFRYDPQFLQARDLLLAGRIGRPVMLHADVLAPLSPDSAYVHTEWRQKPEHIGGYLSDGGVHQTAALQLLAGRVRSVQGIITSFDPSVDPTDTLLANLRFESGAVGHLTYSVGVQQGEPSGIRVYGTGGRMVLGRERIEITTDAGTEEVEVEREPGGYDREFLDFYRAIREGKTPDVSPEDALADLAVIEAVFTSSREGVVVSLD